MFSSSLIPVGDRKRINIIEATASQWKELGTALKLESYYLQNIESDYHRVKDRCRAVLELWLQGGAADSDDPLTWRTLLLAMVQTGQCTRQGNQPCSLDDAVKVSYSLSNKLMCHTPPIPLSICPARCNAVTSIFPGEDSRTLSGWVL